MKVMVACVVIVITREREMRRQAPSEKGFKYAALMRVRGVRSRVLSFYKRR
jgi:hypothetical protein